MSPLDVAAAEGPHDLLKIRGARVNNLKNVDLDIPRNQLVVLTGPSGSGKSSLAFDTVYAEGQRQYIESLSVYSRQFLHQLERPDVDLIEGLQPTICIDQRPGSQNPRSTVATVTEIYDYLRLLLARLGEPVCYECGEPIRQQSPQQILATLQEMPEGTKMIILAPMVRGRKGRHEEVIHAIRKVGLLRVRIDGRIFELDKVPEIEPRKSHTIEAVVDRVIIRPGIQSRLSESLNLALRLGEGLMGMSFLVPEGTAWEDKLISTKYACPHCDISYEELEPRTFSFNSPYGACPDCDGLGVNVEFDPELVIPDWSQPLSDAVAPWRNSRPATRKKQERELEPVLSDLKLDWNTPLEGLDDKEAQLLVYGDAEKRFGIVTLLEKEYATSTSQKRLTELERYREECACSSCEGSRLRAEANSVRLGDRSILEITSLAVSDARLFFSELEFDEQDELISTPLVSEIVKRLEFLEKVGVGYLNLNRPADTLSGGELQRVRLASSIGSGLTGVCYVLDEPTIGLHPRDNQRLIDALRELQQAGNTVLVVEHDEAMMRQADRLVDIGPAAGQSGGQVVLETTPDALLGRNGEPSGNGFAASPTAMYLTGERRIELPSKRRATAKTRSLKMEGANANNLQGVDVRFPLGAFVCVTGVSGSGKSTLVNETLARAVHQRLGGGGSKPGEHVSLRGVSQLDKLIEIDQSPIGRTPRSNAATYTGVFDEIRKVFAGTREAKQKGFRANRFSFNVKGGRCEVCQGHGVQRIEMNFLPDLFVPCSECNGQRFNHQTLQIRYRDRSIAQVLDMSVADGVEFFENFANIHRLLLSLEEVGLGYLKIGQPSTTISGGEAQRIKLATQLARLETGKTLYILDEPTTGLHFEDIRRLLDVLQKLVDKGNSVIVIEHNLDVIKCADWVIDLGPEGGAGGGQVVATGTPEDICQLEGNHTGRFLQEVLNRGQLNS